MNFSDMLDHPPQLLWLPERGVGFFPVSAQPYDEAYWQRYRQYDATEMGAKLTQARIKFIKDNYGFLPQTMVDIGIGGGRFCMEAGCMGADINPVADRWLRDNGKQWDANTPVASLTFWDSFEHIAEPAKLLEKCTDMVFMSMPIYDDCEHILRSKHFRKDEHCWYFTEAGLRWYMRELGWAMFAQDFFESRLGREDIGSFAFRRV